MSLVILCGEAQGPLRETLRRFNSASADMGSEKRMEDQNRSGMDFTISPNPTTDQITIQLPSNGTVRWTINIFDSIGNTVYVLDNVDVTILNVDVSKLSQGFYHLVAFNEQEMLSGKVLKQ